MGNETSVVAVKPLPIVFGNPPAGGTRSDANLGIVHPILRPWILNVDSSGNKAPGRNDESAGPKHDGAGFWCA